MLNNQRVLMHGRRLMVACMILIVVLALTLSATAQEPNVPAVAPEGEIGLAIFADRCAICHGTTGAGDGEMAANLSSPPVSFADSEYRKTALPSIMFETIMNGRFDLGMPPFGPGTENSEPISVENIWNLIAAVYSLSTPNAAVAEGQAVYEANCASCHGDSGAGDGVDALDLTGSAYWFTRSNEMVFADVEAGGISEHDYTLSDDEQWAVIDYARTFSYGYLDPFAPAEPIESAVIGGTVMNGTLGEALGDTTARLRAFTMGFEQTLNLTTTVDAAGSFSFDLTMVDPDWVYLASVNYKGFGFSSDAVQLSRVEPELDLPITVYEHTTNSDAIVIDQMHVILEFFEGGVAASELYVVSNLENALYVGETGAVEDGTIQIILPAGAQNVSFERSMGTFENSIPATEFIETSSGWADTLPLHPGQGGFTLIVSYVLPYEDSADLSHEIAYAARNVTIIMPDANVELAESGWSFQGSQQMTADTSFLTYNRANVEAGTNLSINLNGKPELTATTGSTLPERDQTSELLIGVGVLFVVGAAAFFAVRSWQSKPQGTQRFEEDDDQSAIDELLRDIAALDSAYEDGAIDENQYSTHREKLKSQLKALWE